MNIHLHCLVLDGAFRCDADGAPIFVEAAAPTDDERHALLQTVIAGVNAEVNLTHFPVESPK